MKFPREGGPILSPRQVSSGSHLITTYPTITTCYRCSAPVLAATISGLDVHVDPVALNDLGELTVLLSGRHSYEMRGEELFLRRPEHIRASRSGFVLGAHGCEPVSEEHTDHTALARAESLVRSLLGVAPDENSDAPPPF